MATRSKDEIHEMYWYQLRTSKRLPIKRNELFQKHSSANDRYITSDTPRMYFRYMDNSKIPMYYMYTYKSRATYVYNISCDPTLHPILSPYLGADAALEDRFRFAIYTIKTHHTTINDGLNYSP